MDILYLNGGPLKTRKGTAAEWEVKKQCSLRTAENNNPSPSKKLQKIIHFGGELVLRRCQFLTQTLNLDELSYTSESFELESESHP